MAEPKKKKEAHKRLCSKCTFYAPGEQHCTHEIGYYQEGSKVYPITGPHDRRRYWAYQCEGYTERGKSGALPKAGTFFLVEPFKLVAQKRGVSTKRGEPVVCRKCRTRIGYVACLRRLYKRDAKTNTVADTKTLAEVIHIFCPRCDGTPPAPLPGSIVYRDELTTDADWR